MSQHDLDIAPGRGIDVRQDINAALMALATLNSGNTEPPTKVPGMFWADTGAGRLKRRNLANTAWIDCGPVDAWDALPLSGGTLTGALNEAAGANIASAATTNIGAATGNYINITGTTTITSFGPGTRGAVRELRFSGSLTLTHNATTLILPGGANVVTQAGDIARFRSEGGSAWRCVGYQRADGTTLSSASIYSPSQQVFTSSGTFTVPSGVTTVYLSGVGGGGGGGGVPGNAQGGSTGTVAGGGGAGEYCIRRAISVTPGASISVTIGAGGVGGANSGSNNPGGNGGATTFGDLLTLAGGTGGGGYQSPFGGGNGGCGTVATKPLVKGGSGGSSPFGRGVGEVAVFSGTGAVNGGSAPANSGCGGGGAAHYNSALGGTGGTGGSGYLLVEW